MLIACIINGVLLFTTIIFIFSLLTPGLHLDDIATLGQMRIFFKIILPMMRPALATVGILTFMGAWNDFMGPLLYVRDDSLMTLQLALYNFKTEVPGTNLEQLWAMTTMIAVPVVIVFFCLQKNFIKAFTGVGVK